MSRVEQVLFTCDLNPEDGEATPHTLTLDGTTVQIDLCAECLDLLVGYLEGGRPPVARDKPGQRSRTARDRRRTREIRAWAVREGLMREAGRGRLPGDVVAKYEAEHGGAR